MKFLKQLGAALIAVSALVACGSGVDYSSPEEVAKAVVMTSSSGDTKGFKELLLLPSDLPKEMDIDSKVSQLVLLLKEEYSKRVGEIQDVKVLEVKEQGDLSFVTVEIKGSNTVYQDRLRLRKQGDRWYFDPQY